MIMTVFTNCDQMSYALESTTVEVLTCHPLEWSPSQLCVTSKYFEPQTLTEKDFQNLWGHTQ